MIARRTFLAGLAAASAAAPWPSRAAIDNAAYIAVARRNDGTHALIGLDTDGRERFTLPLPARGHAGAAHPTRSEAVVFSESAGLFTLVIDMHTGGVIGELTPPDGQQLTGHGVFADGGATLLTLEHLATGAEGQVGLWDVASGYTRIGEIPAHGLAPHDLRLMPDGRTLVIANGGTLSGPDGDGEADLAEMEPSLAYVSLAGDLLEDVRLDVALHQCSIRHLALRDDGLVGFAMRWEGAPDVGPPLLGLHRRGETPVLVQAQHANELAMKGAAGSAAFSGDGREVAIVSNRSGRLHRFTAEGLFLGAEILTGIGGIAPHPAGFIATDSDGGVYTFGADGAEVLAQHDLAWEAHILVV